MKSKQANTYTIQCMWQGISLKSEKNNHDLTFYCTQNQLCVPQYKLNVQSKYLGCITLGKGCQQLDDKMDQNSF